MRQGDTTSGWHNTGDYHEYSETCSVLRGDRQRMFCAARRSAIASVLISTSGIAASWQDSLSSAASQLSAQGANAQQGGMSLSALTGLLSNGAQSLSADNMNNAAGILQYCAKQKLASATNVENVKNQILNKLGLDTTQQEQDTNYLNGLQGLLKTKDGQQLNLNNIGSTPLAEKVKTKACDLVLQQGLNFLS
ncbi:Putative glycoprotein/receptor [Salmonella enterica subsp. enterica serovar Gaminara str. A4-567]|nr:Putative glycoprotein/receptor [Salmonella enterica subsp. enterica serovar Gaminara str. A4-567]